MPRWITIPVCPECADLMKEDEEGDYQCIDCEHTLYADDLDQT